MSIIELGKRIAQKHLAQRSQERLERQDEGLPYGARIGSLLEVPRSSFALLEGSLLTVPGSAQAAIEAVSRIRVDSDASLELWRLYTHTGEPSTGKGQAFLQVLTRQGAPVEAVFYQQLLRLIPATEEEQSAYQGHGYGLGSLEYCLGRDLLSKCELDEKQINTLLGARRVLVFARDTPVNSPYIHPYTATENRLDEPFGMKGQRQRMVFMPYARALGDDQSESLFISFNVVQTRDGRVSPAVHVDFSVGLALEPQKLKVL